MKVARYRFRDGRKYDKTYSYDWYSTGTCGVAPAWTNYYTGAAPAYGTFSYTDDVIGDKPDRKKGVSGYRFHPFALRSVSCGVGEGTGWMIRNIAQTCPVPNNYWQHWKSSGTMPPARSASGLNPFEFDINGRLVTPDILDYNRYRRELNLCVTSCLSKVGRGGSSSNLYETVAEVNKTLAIVSQYLELASKIAKSKRLIDKVKAVGNCYLLTRYGFKPLVSDIFGSLEALKVPLGECIESSREKSSMIFESSWNTLNYDANAVYIAGTVTRTQTVKVRAVSLNRYQKNLVDALGLGYKNLMTVPWELLPYSFVVDWFVNVGDFIGSLAPNVGIDPIGSCYTVEVETKDLWLSGATTPYNPVTQVVSTPVSGGKFEVTYKYKNRILGLPAPQLVIKPDFKFDGLTRCMDASALLLQRLKR